VSLPLFSDAERAEVGTLYKQVNADQAFLRGLEIAGAKLRNYVERARKVAPQGQVLLYCWRGGQRSGSMAWLLERAGLQVAVVEGGYKALRSYGKQYLASLEPRLRVLGGPTGSGKTEVLRAMAKQGSHVLDLEALAHHQGSAFGGLGQAPQPTNEQFENELITAALAIAQDGQPIWVEDESRGIGRVYLPEGFYTAMQAAPLYQLELPQSVRLGRLVSAYGRHPIEALQDAFAHLRKRMGGQFVKAAQEALAAGKLELAAQLALSYYDRAYAHGQHKRARVPVHTIRVQAFDVQLIAQQLQQYE